MKSDVTAPRFSEASPYWISIMTTPVSLWLLIASRRDSWLKWTKKSAREAKES